MRIIVKAKTKAKIAKVERVDLPALPLKYGREQAGQPIQMVTYKVSVKEAPVAGKANEAIIRALAEYFDTSPSRITLISGQTSKQKVFEID